MDVVDFIRNQYEHKGINRKISLHGVQRILTEILYAGYIEYPKWNIGRRKAQFDGFISLETYEEVQRVLNDRFKPRIRRDTNPAFPLRGLIVCSLCRKPLTASFNTGHHGQRYPNYFCKSSGCPLQNKIIHRSDVEENFVSYLETVKVGKPIANLAKAVLCDVWTRNEQRLAEAQHTHERMLQEVSEQIEKTTSRIRQTANEKLIGIYEEELIKLYDKKENVEASPAPLRYTQEQFGTAAEKVCGVLENPSVTWQTGTLNDKFAVYFMHFDQKPVYDREVGFGTAPLAQSVELIRSLGSEKTSSVEMPSNELGSERLHCKHLQA